MPASAENESEILLGNKQLLAVFAVVAILLATAFTGGYMLGKSSAEKKAAAAMELAITSQANQTGGGPLTQKITPDDPAAKTEAAPVETLKTPVAPAPAAKPDVKHAAIGGDENILGKPKPAGTPRHGESFVQVMAVEQKEAQATVDVLREHQFKARVAPAPGASGVYRVLVGPSKDAADLRKTEDALRKIGYTKCFVQHY